MTLGDFRAVLRGMSAASLAALLHELGFELYRREVSQWRSLSALADELLDRETFAARNHLSEEWLRSLRRKQARPRRRRRGA